MKNFFKRYLPAKHKIQQHRHLHLFGDRLHDPNIWHLTRHSAAGGTAVGLFCAFIPFPIQTLSAAAMALVFRVNLPLAVVFSLASNPITIPPLFILAYKTGAVILNVPEQQVTFNQISFDFSMDWFGNTLITIWEPLLLGCLILGGISAAIGYALMRLLWRFVLLHKWGKRRALMNNKKQNQG